MDCAMPSGSSPYPFTAAKFRARSKPIRAAAVASEYMARTVGADPRYARFARNPLYCDGRDGFHVEYGRRAGYHITGELLEYVPRRLELPRAEQLLTRTGAHNWLFEAIMRFAGRRSNVEASLLTVALSLNDKLPPELRRRESDARQIARMAEKYRSEWERRDWHSEAFLERQREKGRLGGLASITSWERRDWHSEAFLERQREKGRLGGLASITSSETARERGHQGGIKSGQKRWSGSDAERKPWEQEGVSRRTYYRRRARQRDKMREAAPTPDPLRILPKAL